MPLHVFNTASRALEPFVPANPKVVRMYVCGLTVYAPMHIGHARTYCFWDTFRRWLEHSGYHVIGVINYTDIDDRIIAGGEESRGCVDLAEQMIAGFRRDCRALHIKDYAAYTRATDFVDEQVSMVAQLIEKGHAYVKDGEVFYEVASFPRYGALSHRVLAEQEVGACGRLEEDIARKRHPNDFTLWKPSDEGQPAWTTGQEGWPQGRPGWHIECSAMSTALLGDHFDVHGGGIDNLFPHHENEVAQSEPLCGHPWVRYWLHPEHLDLRGTKMSKSLGNVVGVSDLVERHGVDVVRWFFSTHHYRTKLPFDWDLLEQAAAGYQRIKRLVDVLAERLSGAPASVFELPRGSYPSQRPPELRVPRMRHTYTTGKFGAASEQFIEKFTAAMNDDLDAPTAMAALFEYVSGLYAAGIEAHPEVAELLPVYRCLTAHLAIFGVEIARPELHAEVCVDYAVPPSSGAAAGRGGDEVVDRLLALRTQARKDKDFAKGDMIRKLLIEAGVEVEDSPQGTRWSAR
ncbi:cysteine--tRNA ligase [Chondromyces crocatus]|uniref:Cysteine--tRNA ligase n=1 Tax=Chondromyces crocatus TaxID=52 RepID=A0A0K1ELY3_CHOCO|nr:cysteine--tRNA ligase [Chondromyces crocatus]AKT41910.1 cysteinyl-tRNA synthetase [Chondromyces crocatus]